MAIYGNFFEAVESILAHVRDTKHRVECDDAPMKLLLGFRCSEEPGVRWHFRMTTIKEIALPDATENETLRSHMVTVTGRERIAEGFSEGRCIWKREPL